MHDSDPNRSTGTLISDALLHMSGLVRSEVDLARSEVTDNVKKAAIAVGAIAASIVIAVVAFNILVSALVIAITKAGIPAGWSALLVGCVLVLSAYVMATQAIKELQLSNLSPTRTAENVRRDAQAVKDSYNDK